MKRILYVACLCVVFGGCGADYSPKMDAFDGRHISEVVADWGEPTSITETPDGAVYTWRVQSPSDYLRYETKTFCADSKGVIYDWSWEGSGGSYDKAHYRPDRPRDPNATAVPNEPQSRPATPAP